MLSEIIALSYAVEAADTQSFARAAARAGIKQATLSKRISQLEMRLGLKLFERSTRGVSPTEAGFLFLEQARRVLADFEDLYSHGRAVGSGQRGSLGLGFSTSLASGNMRALLRALGERFPDICVTCLEGNRDRLSKALLAQTIDFAVLTGSASDLALKRTTLWSERVMVALSPEHRLSRNDRIYWSDLREERFVLPLHDPGPDIRNMIAGRLSEPGWNPQLQTHEVTRDNILTMVSLGRFITVTTDTAVGHGVPGVLLKEVYDPSGSITSLGYAGFWRSDNHNPALALLLGLIRERYSTS